MNADPQISGRPGTVSYHMTTTVPQLFTTGPSSTIRAPLLAARTLNATGQSRVTLSLRYERLRAACGPRQEDKGAEIRNQKRSILAAFLIQIVTLGLNVMECTTFERTSPGCKKQGVSFSKMIYIQIIHVFQFVKRVFYCSSRVFYSRALRV